MLRMLSGSAILFWFMGVTHNIPSAGYPPARGTSDAVANDNRVAAGKLANGVLTVRMEAREVMWYPEEKTSPGIPVYAFAETGKSGSVPGPLIRAPAGTEIRMTFRNDLGKMICLRGLQDGGAAALDTVEVAPGAEREIRFSANTPGTFYYYGRTEAGRIQGPSETVDGELVGAFIVDPPGKKPVNDRVMVITLFRDSLRTLPKPREIEIIALNGLSWPHTERLNYTVGDTVRWRVINASPAPHPMHLHGFYYNVLSRGDAVRDTIYAPRQERKVVTETMANMTTMTMRWTPTRPGNWLFHCHLIFHIANELRISERKPMATGAHMNHAEDGMAGLVVGIQVKPKPGMAAFAPDPIPVKKLRMFVTERANVYDNLPGFSFILQNGNTPPAPDSISLPSSTVTLYKSEPTEVTVINRSKQTVSIHWHGIELSSYYDGVGDWSGWQKRTAPPIAPGDSFVVRMTPDRAGTFIYHTHADEIIQLQSGLYGPLIVLEKGAQPDTTDRLFLLGAAGPAQDATIRSFVNGRDKPEDVSIRAGYPHRFRLINISAGAQKRIRIVGDSAQFWRVVAKDGADLPPWQSSPRPAVVALGPGETIDVEVKRAVPQELELEILTATRRKPTTLTVPLHVIADTKSELKPGAGNED